MFSPPRRRSGDDFVALQLRVAKQLLSIREPLSTARDAAAASSIARGEVSRATKIPD